MMMMMINAAIIKRLLNYHNMLRFKIIYPGCCFYYINDSARRFWIQPADRY